MKKKLIRCRNRSPRTVSRVSLAALCFLAVAFTGCASRQTRATTFPWAIAAVVRPRLPQPAPPGNPATAEAPPAILLEAPPAPPALATTRSVPQRPRVPPAPATRNSASEPEHLQMAPRLSAEETSAAQQQTNQNLDIAEKNLATANGKQLNATQLDLASKVRSFVAEAREAAAQEDWSRASSAANKAQVLSEQLVRSL